jgi:hypothetical protein
VDFTCIQLDVGTSKYLVGVTYKPPDYDIMSFNESFSKLLDMLNKFKKHKIILSGDFNINLLNYQSHQPTEEFLDNILSHHQYPVILRPTRFSVTNSTLIDNIFINNITDDYYPGILINDLSDHLPIFYISDDIISHNVKPYSIIKRYRNIDDKSIENFSTMIRGLHWKGSDLIDDANACYKRFIALFGSAYNDCFPWKIMKIRIAHDCHKPWISSGIIKSVRHKDKLYKKWLSTKSERSLYKYKKFKNKLTSVIRSAEKCIISNVLKTLLVILGKLGN